MYISRKTIILIAIPIVVAVLMVAGMEITSQNSFCLNCHNMKVYYETLRTSSHKEVDCVKCHIAPGFDNFVKTKLKGLSEVVVYTIGEEPLVYHAEIEDKTCLRAGCHVKEKLTEEPVNFKKGIVFQHLPHLKPLKGIQLNCVSCHSQMVHGKQVNVTTSTCFTCHFKGGEE